MLRADGWTNSTGRAHVAVGAGLAFPVKGLDVVASRASFRKGISQVVALLTIRAGLAHTSTDCRIEVDRTRTHGLGVRALVIRRARCASRGTPKRYGPSQANCLGGRGRDWAVLSWGADRAIGLASC